MSDALKPPYIWWGGKREVTEVMWAAFGHDVPNFIDPAFGSNSVLLGRPGGPGKIETINDLDRMAVNFWRSVVADPWATAEWCDGPVCEADMHAWHVWLVEQLRPGADFRERMHTDPNFFDSKIAGRWCWGINQWIGSGWCVEPQNHKHPRLDGVGKGTHRIVRARQRPHVSGTHPGNGTHSARPPHQVPQLRVHPRGGTGNGTHSSLPDGYAARLPSIGNDRGIHGVSTTPGTFLNALHELSVPDAPRCFEWFHFLMLRLQRVRIINGDWKRVLSDSVLGKGKNVGGRRPCAVVLDGPYDPDLRCADLYAEDRATVAIEMREWAIAHGDDPDLRIALCGYFEEHAEHMPKNWVVYRWVGRRGYAKAGNENRKQETVWFSPHCLPLDRKPNLLRQADLFDNRETA